MGTGCGDGTLATLHNFSGSDGASPVGVLIQGADGTFYGTTIGGGAYTAGTIYALTPDGTLTTLYTFTYGGSTGRHPTRGPIWGVSTA